MKKGLLIISLIFVVLCAMFITASAEDRFNFWMDIYPRSASLKGDFEELYKKHKESL